MLLYYQHANQNPFKSVAIRVSCEALAVWHAELQPLLCIQNQSLMKYHSH